MGRWSLFALLLLAIGANAQYGGSGKAGGKAAAPARPKSTEQRLYDHVMTGYSRDVRPSFDGRPIEILLDPTIERLIDVDEEAETVTYSHWSLVWWTDDHFKWEPADFDGMENLYMHASDIWQPDITAYETVKCAQPVGERNAIVRLSHDGWVRMNVAEQCTMTCPMQGSDTTHKCTVRYVSWMMPNTHATVANYGTFDIATAGNTHRVWNIAETGVDVTVDDYGIGKWQTANYYFVINKRPEA